MYFYCNIRQLRFVYVIEVDVYRIGKSPSSNLRGNIFAEHKWEFLWAQEK